MKRKAAPGKTETRWKRQERATFRGQTGPPQRRSRGRVGGKLAPPERKLSPGRCGYPHLKQVRRITTRVTPVKVAGSEKRISTSIWSPQLTLPAMGWVGEKSSQKVCTDFAQISASAQFRTTPARPHDFAHVFFPFVACRCQKELANKGVSEYW